MIRKGLVVLALWAGYDLLSYAYFGVMTDSSIARAAAVLLGAGFYAMWFFYGFKLRLGWRCGVKVGLMGALPGVLMLAAALFFLATGATRDNGQFWVMLPWTFPVAGLVSVVGHSDLRLYIPHLSVPLAVVLTGLGGWLGARQKRSVAA